MPLKYVSDILQMKEAFTVTEYKHTHTHTHTHTHNGIKIPSVKPHLEDDLMQIPILTKKIPRMGN